MIEVLLGEKKSNKRAA